MVRKAVLSSNHNYYVRAYCKAYWRILPIMHKKQLSTYPAWKPLYKNSNQNFTFKQLIFKRSHLPWKSKGETNRPSNAPPSKKLYFIQIYMYQTEDNNDDEDWLQKRDHGGALFRTKRVVQREMWSEVNYKAITISQTYHYCLLEP